MSRYLYTIKKEAALIGVASFFITCIIINVESGLDCRPDRRKHNPE